ncbi:MAG: PD-(D/E)XK nuclease family protein [Chryseobacterium sp.]|nr:MAG: PD-(D/E)XK nuclease family protein [Chryseobacterium sp.]
MRKRNCFLHDVLDEIFRSTSDLRDIHIIMPGKRPAIFFRQILEERKYQGFLPKFMTIEELLEQIAGVTRLKGVALWFFAYEVFKTVDPAEELQSFLKWFPTVAADWDDMLKFADSDKAVLEYMLDEERIRNWGEILDESPRRRNLDFWQKMNVFLPELQRKLDEKNWATDGMIHRKVAAKTEDFARKATVKYIFCGFNAIAPAEEQLMRTLMQWENAEVLFQADEYYMDDTRQEAGKFLRRYKDWKEFNEHRPFRWIHDSFNKPKSICTYEASGNVTQAKFLPQILKELTADHTAAEQKEILDNTAVVLLDENLLPSALESLSEETGSLNITMGFPLKNLSYSIIFRKLFYLQKQLERGRTAYYYGDLLPVLEELMNSDEDRQIITAFLQEVERRNLVYISFKILEEWLGKVSFYSIFLKPKSAAEYLELLIGFCQSQKEMDIQDVQYENISIFENAFRTLLNLARDRDAHIAMETLESLVSQLVNTEAIDFEGEPLTGLQVMGLLETRLLNFPNVILLSANEGKLPLGRSENTYIPYDIRRNFGLNTFLENDSIFAYHFYRLIQEAQNVYIMYNGLTSGANTGEKSRFITQMEMESNHRIKRFVISSNSEPLASELKRFVKNDSVIQRLAEWQKRVSPSHLISYLYDPAEFYLNYILSAKEPDEMEEELSSRNFGNLVHYVLQELYDTLKGKQPNEADLQRLLLDVDAAMDRVIVERLQHTPDYYKRGMNFIYKSMALRAVRAIIGVDIDLVRSGSVLEIIDLERNLTADLLLDDGRSVTLYGFADRIDRVDGKLRILDYKTGSAEKLDVGLGNKTADITRLLCKSERKQQLQLSVYAYCALSGSDFADNFIYCGIWSFVNPSSGPSFLTMEQIQDISLDNLHLALMSVRTLIAEILDPSVDFVETVKASYEL